MSFSKSESLSIVRNRRTNIALGRPCHASSPYGLMNRLPMMAFDGNLSTCWTPDHEYEKWIYVDLGSIQAISSVVLIWDSVCAKTYQIQVSNDESTWISVYYNYDDDSIVNEISLSINAKYVKLYARQKVKQLEYSLREMEVWSSFMNPINNQFMVLEYLKNISGSQTVIGIHNREPNSAPAMQTNRVHDITGLWPGLWSADLLFSADDVSNRWTMIHEALVQWKNGSIVQIMMHVIPPTQSEPGSWAGGVISHLNDSQWNDLITDGGYLNRAWKDRLDNYANYFQFLKDNNVQLLLRPFHEMNQGLFWWAGRPGFNGTAALYRLTHDYLLNIKGLTNLIWIWSVQDLDYNWAVYNPGNDYWDIFSVDVYNSDGFTTQKYETAIIIAEDKPIAIGECEKLPTSIQLASQQRWVFVMSWAELTFSSNTNASIRSLYSASNIITRDKLPRLFSDTLNPL